MLKQHALEFLKWIRENDTIDNAEQYFGYTDSNMYDQFIKQANEKNSPKKKN